MPYNFASESFHTKKLCSRLFFEKSPIFIRKIKKSLLRPPFGVRRNVRVHLRLIGKLVGDFLLVIIERSLGAFVLSQYTSLTDGQTDVDSKTVRMLRSRTVKTDTTRVFNSGY